MMLCLMKLSVHQTALCTLYLCWISFLHDETLCLWLWTSQVVTPFFLVVAISTACLRLACNFM